MASRTDSPVTLSHQDAQSVARMLGEFATQQSAQAQRSRSEAARAGYRANVRLARWLEARIVERLYTWTDTTPAADQSGPGPTEEREFFEQ